MGALGDGSIGRVGALGGWEHWEGGSIGRVGALGGWEHEGWGWGCMRGGCGGGA